MVTDGSYEHHRRLRWYPPCLAPGVSEMPSHATYDEPVVMWRMQRANGMFSHAMIGPRPDGAFVVWFVNGRPVGYRDFSDWTSALGWSDLLRSHNWAAGWRLAAE